MDMTMDDEQQVLLSEDQETSYKAAGFWMRFWAYIIDGVILFGINGLLLSPLGFLNEGMPIELGFWTVNGILAGTIFYLYFLFMTKIYQQTIGKMILGIKVVSDRKEKLSWGDVFFREVIGRIIYNVFFVLKLLYLVVAFTNKKQGLHDLIGNTRVIHEAS